MGKNDLKAQIKLCDGILFGGGRRILPYELYIYDYITKIDKPVLGICLGMELMGYSENKNNLQKNNTVLNHCQPDKKYLHKVLIDNSSILF